jgi:hypothetical protein
MTLVVALAAGSTRAQDSTSTSSAIGDAVFAWEDATGPYGFGSEQVNRYVVDTQLLTSSWGKKFRIAPLIKASKIGYNYLNGFLSAQGISNTQLAGVGFPFSSYDLWTQPQYGVNNVFNLPGMPITPTGLSNQFAVGFADYDYSDQGTTLSINSIVGGLVNYKPAEPARLYVARITAAVNGSNDGEETAQFGFGSVDSHGRMHFRADGYQCDGPAPITDNNYFRVNLPARNPNARNKIDALGASDAAASQWLLMNNPTTHSPPSIVPGQVAGRPVLVGSNYNNQFVRESSPYPSPLVADSTHLAPGVGVHKGCVAFSHHLICTDGRVGTMGMIGKESDAAKAEFLNLWGVDANGDVVPGSPIGLNPYHKLALPAGGAFDGYHGTHGMRGGNGLVAIGKDQAGRGLAAGTWSYSGSATDAYNAILVSRFDCADPDPQNAEWTIAAQVTTVEADRTAILDGPGGNAIGRLAPRKVGTNFVGPSISAPAMDSVGNIYFLAVCEINASPENYFPYCLLRAVYSPASFTYELELLLESGAAAAAYGDIFHGRNSNTDYKITYLTLAYTSGLSSGAFFSGNILQTAFSDMNPAVLSPADPRTLGGLVVNAEIVYDTNGDGVFDSTLGVDESYKVLLYMGADPGLAVCVGDLNCDGQIDFKDINPFVQYLSKFNLWQSQYPGCNPLNGDINGDGVYGQGSFGDINPFVTLLASAPLPIPCP